MLIAQGFQFITFIILGRLLSPSDFGLMALALFFTGIMRAIVEFGLGMSIIQNKENNVIQNDSIFWVSLLLGVTVAIITFASSSIISSISNSPELNTIIKLLSIIYLIDSLKIVPNALLVKSYQFRKLTVINVYNGILYGIITIILAYFGFGVYSLVIGYLISALFSSVQIFFSSRYFPSFTFKISSIRHNIKFGFYLTLSSVLGYFSENIERFIIGKYLGVTELGYYNFSQRLVNYPRQIISQNLGKVLFPAFSEIQNDKERLKAAYLKVIRILFILVVPFLFFASIISDYWIPLFFGSKWNDAVIPFIILSFSGAIAAIGSPLGNVYIAKGKTKMELYFTITTLILTTVLYFSFSPYGLLFLCVANVIYRLLSLLIVLWLSGKYAEVTFKEYLVTFAKPFYVSSVLILIIFISKLILSSLMHNDLINLIIIISIFIMIYLYFLYYTDNDLLSEIKNLFLFFKNRKLDRFFSRSKD
jgi:O-antigen/teichoic acid export membrane protein